MNPNSFYAHTWSEFRLERISTSNPEAFVRECRSTSFGTQQLVFGKLRNLPKPPNKPFFNIIDAGIQSQMSSRKVFKPIHVPPN